MRLSKTSSVVEVWWSEVNEQLGLFLSVIASGQEIPDSDVEAAMMYISVRLPQIEALKPPTEMADVHQGLVTSLENMKQSLIYRLQDNDLSAQTRYDIARGNIDSIRFRLLQHNIIL